MSVQYVSTTVVHVFFFIHLLIYFLISNVDFILYSTPSCFISLRIFYRWYLINLLFRSPFFQCRSRESSMFITFLLLKLPFSCLITFSSSLMISLFMNFIHRCISYLLKLQLFICTYFSQLKKTLMLGDVVCLWWRHLFNRISSP